MLNLRDLCQTAQENPELFKDHLQKQLENIEQRNAELNALLRYYLSSRNLPQIFPGILASKLGKPLFGTTFVVKDNFSVKGQPLSWGLKPPVTDNSPEHASAVQFFINLGASLLGSANLDPAALGNLGNNSFYGRVQNPEFRSLVAGGSSSGCAAAVAAGFCDFAIGSDLNGSIRIPAAACKLVGYKFSNQSFDRQGSLQFDYSGDSVGLLLNSLNDLDFILQKIEQADANQLNSENQIVFIPTSTDLQRCTKEIREFFQQSVDSLAKAGYQIELLPEHTLTSSLKMHKNLIARAVAEKFEKSALPENAPEELLALRALGQKIKLTAQDLNAEHANFKSKLLDLLDEHTFVLTPSMPDRPLKVSKTATVEDPAYFLSLANTLDLPAVSFPLDSSRLWSPSLQVIGATRQRHNLIQQASCLDRLLRQN